MEVTAAKTPEAVWCVREASLPAPSGAQLCACQRLPGLRTEVTLDFWGPLVLWPRGPQEKKEGRGKAGRSG